MKLTPLSLVNVFYMRGKDKLKMGRLAIKNRQIYFEYHNDFLSTGLRLSPLKLPLQSGVIPSPDRLFDGLFGIFNDSLPDGWGRLLLDRQITSLGTLPDSLTPLDRLCFVGKHGMGALIFEPEIENESRSEEHNLDKIAEAIFAFQEKNDLTHVAELLNLNGSSAGARPKSLLHINGEDWIVKFPSSLDPIDIGPIEYAYHLMAVEAGLIVPAAELFPAKNRAGYFGVKRFDRSENLRFHMHSLSGLLHVDHRIPALDYQTIIEATLWLSQNQKEAEIQFRAAVFNIMSHNRDDHAKNFSYLMDPQGQWHVSPAYDLTFSSGPAGEHCTMIMGEGKNPTLKHLLALAEIAGVTQEKAKDIIEEVRHAITHWSSIATNVGVTKKSLRRIQSALTKILNDIPSHSAKK